MITECKIRHNGEITFAETRILCRPEVNNNDKSTTDEAATVVTYSDFYVQISTEAQMCASGSGEESWSRHGWARLKAAT